MTSADSPYKPSPSEPRPSETLPPSFLENLRGRIQTHTQSLPWQPQDLDWTAQLTREISSRILDWIDHSKVESGSSGPTIDPSELAERIENAVFFVPTAVERIYTLTASPDMEPFAQEGINIHCRFIKCAIANVVRKFSGSIRRLGMSPQDMEDELWGTTMEDLVKLLTDNAARLWLPGQARPVVLPPDGERSLRRQTIVRVALSPDARRAALFHSGGSLSVWDTDTRDRVGIWDLSLLDEVSNQKNKAIPVGMYFSTAGDRMAVEWPSGAITGIDLNNESTVTHHSTDRLEPWAQEFGVPFVPDRESCASRMEYADRSGQDRSRDYLNRVYDWTCGASGAVILTAGEMDRSMPVWMRDIGFERALYMIIKRRLIDQIRKNTHTGYACWNCGAETASPGETQCSRCGLDFTRCPIGCPIPPSETLDQGNQWTCPHCGCASRTQETAREQSAEEIEELSDYELDYESKDWQGEHDLARIQTYIANRYVTYRRRQIPMNRILDLKAQGLTNEEIGTRLDIPRGSIDYIWNQCRDEILRHFGETKSGRQSS